jgi:hypothetical protein
MACKTFKQRAMKRSFPTGRIETQLGKMRQGFVADAKFRWTARLFDRYREPTIPCCERRNGRRSKCALANKGALFVNAVDKAV